MPMALVYGQIPVPSPGVAKGLGAPGGQWLVPGASGPPRVDPVNLPISSRYRSQPNEPVTEAERSRLSAQLNEAFERGEIDQPTYSRLLDQVFGAQRLGDLIGPVEALGKPATYDVPAIVEQAQGRPGELTQARTPAARTQLMLVGGIGALVLAVVLLLVVLL